MNKKYELIADDFIEHNGKKLYRIRALRDFDKPKHPNPPFSGWRYALT